MKRLKTVAVAFCLPLLLFSQNITITHGPYLQKVGEEGVTVIWTTDKDAVSWVELAPAGNDSFYSEERPRYYDTAYGNKAVGKLHRVTITGLTPGTEYRYRIFSKEVSGYEGHRINFPVLINDDETCLQVEVSDKITVKTKDLTGKILHTHTFYPQK